MHRNTKHRLFSKHGLNSVRRIDNEPKKKRKEKKSDTDIKDKLIAKEDLSDKKSNIEKLIQTFFKLKSKIWLSLTHGHFVFI